MDAATRSFAVWGVAIVAAVCTAVAVFTLNPGVAGFVFLLLLWRHKWVTESPVPLDVELDLFGMRPD